LGQLEIVAHLIGAVFEQAEPVVVGLEEVSDLVERVVVERQPGGAHRVALLLGQLRQHVVELAARVLVHVEQRGHGGRHARLGAELGQVFLAQIERAQQRLVEQAGEAVVHATLAQAVHELLHAHAVELQRLEQQRQLNGALVLLDQAQVGGGNPESPRDLALL